MGVTVGVNKKSVVHKGSGGVSIAPLNFCKIQMGPAVVVVPLPNIAESKNLNQGTKKVRCDGQPVAIDGCVLNPSRGDESGRLGGVMSGKVQGYARFTSFSHDVRFEGKPVARNQDMLIHNDMNTMTAPIKQEDVAASPGGDGQEDEVDDCPKCHKKHQKKAASG